MKPHDSQWRDALVTYVAGTAETDVREVVERHLDEGCEQCEGELLSLGALGVAAATVAPRPTLRRVCFAAAIAAMILIVVRLVTPPEPARFPVAMEWKGGEYVAYDVDGREVWRWRSSGRPSGVAPVLLSIGAGMPAYVPVRRDGEIEIVRVNHGNEDEDFAKRLGPSMEGRTLRRLFAVRSAARPCLLLVLDQGGEADRRSSLLLVDAKTGASVGVWHHSGELAPAPDGDVDSLVIEIGSSTTLILVGGYDKGRQRACVHMLDGNLVHREGLTIPRLNPDTPAVVKVVQPSSGADGVRFARIGTTDGIDVTVPYSTRGWGAPADVSFIDEVKRALGLATATEQGRILNAIERDHE